MLTLLGEQGIGITRVSLHLPIKKGQQIHDGDVRYYMPVNLGDKFSLSRVWWTCDI